MRLPLASWQCLWDVSVSGMDFQFGSFCYQGLEFYMVSSNSLENRLNHPDLYE